MRPSDALRDRVEAVRAIIARSPFENPRVFGSVARGEDDEQSDLDLLVDIADRASLFDLARLQMDLEELLGVRVDILTADSVSPRVARDVFRHVRPV